MATKEYKLPELPYAYNALEPYISKQIMELHHSKHHATYVLNLNKTLTSPKTSKYQSLVSFNAGGHINHSIFWKNLTPASSPAADPTISAPKLLKAITEKFGSLEDFKTQFGAALLGIQGSGWGWLVLVAATADESEKLEIVTTKDQDPVKEEVGTVIFGVDMWEHAYYLQYLNGKAAYVENVWKILNWGYAEARFVGEEGKGEFGELKAML